MTKNIPTPHSTTPGWNGLRSNRNEEVFHTSQSSRTEASPSDCFVLYPGHWNLVGAKNFYIFFGLFCKDQ